MCGTLATYWVCFYTKSSDMLNKNTLGVKKVRGQEEAALCPTVISAYIHTYINVHCILYACNSGI